MQDTTTGSTDRPEEDRKEEGEPGCHYRGYGKWSEKRAAILTKPEEVLEGDPGAYIIAEVEVQNQTQWPWKRGCVLAHVLKE